MIKTPQERYDEIKREIIEISESYVLIKQNMEKDHPTKYEQRHFLLLQMELSGLIEELNLLNVSGEINISLLYKDVVNNLKRVLEDSCSAEHREKIIRDVKLIQYLY